MADRAVVRVRKAQPRRSIMTTATMTMMRTTVPSPMYTAFSFLRKSGTHRCRRKPGAPVGNFQAAPIALLPPRDDSAPAVRCPGRAGQRVSRRGPVGTPVRRAVGGAGILHVVLASATVGGLRCVGGPRKDVPLPAGRCRCKACPALHDADPAPHEHGGRDPLFCRRPCVQEGVTAVRAVRGSRAGAVDRPPGSASAQWSGTVMVTVVPVLAGVPGAGDWAVTVSESSPMVESSVKAMP